MKTIKLQDKDMTVVALDTENYTAVLAIQRKPARRAAAAKPSNDTAAKPSNMGFGMISPYGFDPDYDV
jgi:hypothetical protein